MWGDSSCSYPYPDIFCNQLCFKVEYLVLAFSIFLLPKFVCLWVFALNTIEIYDISYMVIYFLRIGLNRLINYFIKHWLLSIIFGLRTALVAIRKNFNHITKTKLKSSQLTQEGGRLILARLSQPIRKQLRERQPITARLRSISLKPRLS